LLSGATAEQFDVASVVNPKLGDASLTEWHRPQAVAKTGSTQWIAATPLRRDRLRLMNLLPIALLKR